MVRLGFNPSICRRTARLPLVLAVLVFLSPRAQGAFANGVDTFAGTTPDTETWAAFPGWGAADGVTQNNGLTLDAQTAGTPGLAAYGTTEPLVGVGQGVRVDVTATRADFGRGPYYGSVFLLLMDRAPSPSQPFWSNERDLNLHSDTIWFSATADKDGDGSGRDLPAPPDQWLYYPPPAGQSWTWRIDRPTLDSAVFSVYDTNHVLQTTWTMDNVSTWMPPGSTPFPERMYVALCVQNATATFTNVTIVPEPTWVFLALLGVLLRPRRRMRA